MDFKQYVSEGFNGIGVRKRGMAPEGLFDSIYMLSLPSFDGINDIRLAGMKLSNQQKAWIEDLLGDIHEQYRQQIENTIKKAIDNDFPWTK